MIQKLTDKEKKENADALKAITSLRQLNALKLLKTDEYIYIQERIYQQYAKYLSPLR